MGTYNDFKKILPQKEPFMFLDGVKSCDTTSKVLIAYKTFKEDEYFLKGHFPNNPLIPGVIIIEALSQACILCGFYSNNSENDENKYEHLMYDVKIKLKNKCYPNDEIYLQSTLIDVIQNVSIFKVKALNKNYKIIAFGEIRGIAKRV
jgi:3-hydroxyacyl-[acyl-carrier-protein] dehydratase